MLMSLNVVCSISLATNGSIHHKQYNIPKDYVEEQVKLPYNSTNSIRLKNKEFGRQRIVDNLVLVIKSFNR